MVISDKARAKYDLTFGQKVVKDWRKFKAVYVLALLGVAYYVIFCYVPIGGILIAFEDFKPLKGVFHSPWVGLSNFKDFFESYYFWRVLRNTLLINFYDLLFGFPAPIIFALLLNEISNKAFKRTVQTISYLPFFISLVVICGILVDFLSLDGLFNQILGAVGVQKINFLAYPQYFRTIYVGSGIWQYMGYGAIIYLAALSGVSVELYDAAVIDGCNRFQRIWHVTMPGILSTVIIMLIMRIGSMMNVGFEKIILIYNPSTFETSDVISSFVYRYGLQQGNLAYGTAVGVFNSVINFALMLGANSLSRRTTDISLF